MTTGRGGHVGGRGCGARTRVVRAGRAAAQAGPPPLFNAIKLETHMLRQVGEGAIGGGDPEKGDWRWHAIMVIEYTEMRGDPYYAKQTRTLKQHAIGKMEPHRQNR